jgi:hypothetical protein
MKEFTKFWYKPPHQRKGKAVVEFELLPLDQRTYLYLKGDLQGRGNRLSLSPDGYTEAFRYAVVGWRGLDAAYSEEEKRGMLHGPANVHVAKWQEQIAGELIRRVALEEDELKNS